MEMTQARRETLQDVMSAICDQAVAEVIQLNRWRDTDSTRRMEVDIDQLQRDVEARRGKLIDFKTAVDRWKMEGTR